MAAAFLLLVLTAARVELPPAAAAVLCQATPAAGDVPHDWAPPGHAPHYHPSYHVALKNKWSNSIIIKAKSA